MSQPGLCMTAVLFSNISSDLGLLHRVSGDAVSQLIHQRIQLHIEQTCKGNYETSFLESAEQVSNIILILFYFLSYSNYIM